MKDEDYIRKAVELADGWGLVIQKGDAFAIFPPNTRPIQCHFRFVRDALAAQLVRQVDATQYEVCIAPSYTEVGDFSEDGEECLAVEDGSDRTMNTIKAIVDSGVLGD
jgi:hypothetical protein